MDISMTIRWKAWLYSLATAAIKAGADAFLLYIVAPEISIAVIAKAVAIGALTSVAHILRESPMPRVEWTKEQREEQARGTTSVEVIATEQKPEPPHGG